MTQACPHVVIVRHPRERLAKCSLEPLRGQPGFEFRKATGHFRFDGTAHLLLAVGAPPVEPCDAVLTPAEALYLQDVGRPALLDAQQRPLRPILLLDSTWRLLPGMRAKITGTPLERSLPPTVRTAYPRTSKIGLDPEAGLASIEALYLALRLLGFDRPDLLAAYHWRDRFIEQLR